MTTNERTASFGYWVRRQRQALDLTQSLLARQVGCATVTISKIERDERRPSRQMAELLAEKLAIPIEQRRHFLTVALGESAADQLPLPNQPLTMPTQIEAKIPPFTLPSAIMPTIARPKEEADLVGLLTNPMVRLVTLVGAGGMGKTHLALQVANKAAPHFRDGVVFIGLETVTDAERVLSTVANGLGVIESSGTTLQETVAAALSYKERLLLLDNFEQVLAAADLVAALLQACPQLKILVTSRAALHLRQERLYPLPPMSLPGSSQATSADVTQSQAVQLFTLRSQAVQPDFVLNDTTAPTVVTICALLDGLPLAIELAAARLALFSLPSLLQELTAGDYASLVLLQSEVRDRPQRQRSLRDTIAWSYELLSTEEQALFSRLSVFVGSFTLDAAKAINAVGQSNGDAAARSTLVILTALVVKTLIVSTPQPDGTTRFRMLNLVREFAAEMLAAREDVTPIRQAHAQWYAALATEADAALTGPDQVQWLDRLSAEAANLHVAISWSIAAREVEVAYTFGATLLLFWRRRNRLSDGWFWLTEILTLPQDAAPVTLQAKVLLNTGIMAMLIGNYPAVEHFLVNSITLARQSNDSAILSYALGRLGRLRFGNHEYAQANALYEEAMRLGEESNNRWELGLALTGLGQNYWGIGDKAKSLQFTQAGLEEFRRLGDIWGIAFASTKVANTLIQQRRFVEAQVYAQESLRHSQMLQDTVTIALSLSTLAWLAIAQEKYDEARKLLKESLQIRWGLGDKHGAADNIAYLAKVVLCCNQPDQAVILAQVAARAFQQMKTPPVRIDLKEIILAARNLLDEASYAAATAIGEVQDMAELVNELLRQ